LGSVTKLDLVRMVLIYAIHIHGQSPSIWLDVAYVLIGLHIGEYPKLSWCFHKRNLKNSNSNSNSDSNSRTPVPMGSGLGWSFDKDWIYWLCSLLSDLWIYDQAAVLK
jgi:hypothetical protein